MKEDVYKNYTTTSVLSGVDSRKFTAWSHRYFRKYILPHFPIEKKSQVLEIGCGYGRYTQLITQTLGYENTVGFDISDEQIEYARKNFNLNNVFKADALEYLSTHSEKYDVVILMDVLEHLELDYAIKMLNAIRASLAPGGKLIIQVPNGLSPMKPIFYGDVTHVRAFSVNSMSQILRMAGFTRFEHRALPILIVNIKNLVQRIVWTLVINPTIHVFMFFSHGSTVGGIYTSNLLTIAEGNQK